MSGVGLMFLVVDQDTILAGGGASEIKFFQAGTNTEVTEAALIAELAATYADVMNFFGLTTARRACCISVHFGRKLSIFYASDSASSMLYTFTAENSDADTEVPQTGEAASSIGFGMIALAIVAAAGVSSLKQNCTPKRAPF